MSDTFYYSKHPLIKRVHKLNDSLPVWFIHGVNTFIDSDLAFEVKNKRVSSNTFVKVSFFIINNNNNNNNLITMFSLSIDH